MVQAVLVLAGDTARTRGRGMASDVEERKLYEQDQTRADLLQAALVKARDCTKCCWDKDYAKGCPECLGSHYDTYRLRKYNMWLVQALEKFGKKASSIKWLGVYFQAFSTDYVVVRLHRGRIVFFNRFYRSQGLRKSDIEPVRPINKNKVGKTWLKERKAKRAEKGSNEAQESEEPSMIPGPPENAAVAGRRIFVAPGLGVVRGRVFAVPDGSLCPE